MKSKKIYFLALAIVIILVGAFLIYKRDNLPAKRTAQQKESLQSPPASREPDVRSQVSISQTSSTQLPTDPIPLELDIDVPFTSQAPSGNWNAIYEEACEEASILMASRYFQKRPIISADDAEQEILEIISWEKENLNGTWESTTDKESVRIIEEKYLLKADLLTDPTVEQIKQALTDKKLVIVPASGRELGNPFYKAPGPIYHMLLIKGYADDQFITNDPGTKRGESYRYNFKTILEANHDWNGGDVSNGKKVMIVVSSSD